jgi:hypothetical protein
MHRVHTISVVAFPTRRLRPRGASLGGEGFLELEELLGAGETAWNGKGCLKTGRAIWSGKGLLGAGRERELMVEVEAA